MLPLIVLALAQSTHSLGSSREYIFVEQPKNWSEAQAYCREHFMDLATMETQEDWEIVREMEGDYSHGHSWMGLYDDVHSWRWSIDNTSLYVNGQPQLGGLPFSTDNGKSKEHCGLLWGGTVHDQNCAESKPSVCYDETTDSYIKVTDPKTWESAQRYCRDTYTDLASMRSEVEKNGFFTAASDQTWTGLFRDSWKWSDQSNFSFQPWATGQPTRETQLCGCTSANGWHDCGCGSNYPFICSVKVTAKRVLKVALKSDGSVNLRDAALQGGMLTNIEKGLKDGGVEENFNLTWRKHPNGQIFTQNATQN